jgi:U3 small nucleolar RNA-associated protein 22
MNRRKINIPFPDPKPAKDVMYKFSYAKPSYINIVGGYALKTLIKQSEGFSIDLIVSMPSVCP